MGTPAPIDEIIAFYRADTVGIRRTNVRTSPTGGRTGEGVNKPGCSWWQSPGDLVVIQSTRDAAGLVVAFETNAGQGLSKLRYRDTGDAGHVLGKDQHGIRGLVIGGSGYRWGILRDPTQVDAGPGVRGAIGGTGELVWAGHLVQVVAR